MPTSDHPDAEEGERERPVMFGRTPFWGLSERERHQQDHEHPEQREHVEVGERDEVVDLVAEIVEVQLGARPGQALDVLLGDGAERGDADEGEAEDHHPACRRALAEVRPGTVRRTGRSAGMAKMYVAGWVKSHPAQVAKPALPPKPVRALRWSRKR